MLEIPTVIHGDKIKLRRHKASDLAAFQAFLTDPKATRFMGFTAEQKTAEGAATMMQAVIASYSTEEPVFSLTIADPDTDVYLGATGAADSGDDAAEVFITLLPEAQGKGLATDAMRTLIGHLFVNFAVRELYADTVEENSASIRLLEGIGFRCEGPIERPAAGGELGHRGMTGLRYRLTFNAFGAQATTR